MSNWSLFLHKKGNATRAGKEVLGQAPHLPGLFEFGMTDRRF
jgi:hypothetical protein